MQILLRAQFHHPPLRKLPMQRLPEPLAILQPRTLASRLPMRFAIQIDQRQGSGSSPKVFHFEFQPSRPLHPHRRHPPD